MNQRQASSRRLEHLSEEVVAGAKDAAVGWHRVRATTDWHEVRDHLCCLGEWQDHQILKHCCVLPLHHLPKVTPNQIHLAPMLYCTCEAKASQKARSAAATALEQGSFLAACLPVATVSCEKGRQHRSMLLALDGPVWRMHGDLPHLEEVEVICRQQLLDQGQGEVALLAAP